MPGDRTRLHHLAPAHGIVAARLVMAKLRAARKAKGLTQFEVAADLNVKTRTFVSWENCHTFPHAAALYAWCELLAVSPLPES